MPESSESSASSPSRVDLISKLLPYQPVLKRLFQYLRPKDLRTVPVVSRNWRTALYVLVPEANHRRLRALKKLKKVKRSVGSENWPLAKPPPRQSLRIREQRALRPTAAIPQQQQQQNSKEVIPKNMLQSIQNTGNCNYQIPRQFDTFRENCEMGGKPAEGKRRSGWILAQQPFRKW